MVLDPTFASIFISGMGDDLFIINEVPCYDCKLLLLPLCKLLGYAMCLLL